jgi:tetratricopeptide (TPR) repeat protein
MRKIESAPLVILSLALAVASSLSHAQTKPSAFEQEMSALSKVRNYDGAEARARKELAAKPMDEHALLWLANLAMSDAKKRAAVEKEVDACVAAQPKAARCHLALGNLLGARAMGDGMLSAMKYAGKIRDSFAKAVELDPEWPQARRSLNQFYLMAPGIAGGGAGKAFTNADDFAKINPFFGKVLRIEAHLSEKEIPKAEALLAGLTPPAGDEGRTTHAAAVAGVGWAHFNNKGYPKALELFDRAAKMDGDNLQHVFGRGRALLEQKQFDAAIGVFEGIAKQDPKYPVEFRLAAAYEGKGDKARAISFYEAFLKRDVVSERQKKEARARIDALKA